MTLTVKITPGLRTPVTFHRFYILYLYQDEQIKRVAYPDVPQHRVAACNCLSKVSKIQKEGRSSADTSSSYNLDLSYKSRRYSNRKYIGFLLRQNICSTSYSPKNDPYISTHLLGIAVFCKSPLPRPPSILLSQYTFHQANLLNMKYAIMQAN